MPAAGSTTNSLVVIGQGGLINVTLIPGQLAGGMIKGGVYGVIFAGIGDAIANSLPVSGASLHTATKYKYMALPQQFKYSRF